MKILSRYVFREILTSSVLATALATFVIFLQGIGKLFELLVHSSKGPAVLELFGLALPPILLLSLPFGVLVGILVGLGRHSLGSNLFHYIRDPWGSWIEYFTDIDRITEDWTPREWQTPPAVWCPLMPEQFLINLEDRP